MRDFISADSNIRLAARRLSKVNNPWGSNSGHRSSQSLDCESTTIVRMQETVRIRVVAAISLRCDCHGTWNSVSRPVRISEFAYLLL